MIGQVKKKGKTNKLNLYGWSLFYTWKMVIFVKYDSQKYWLTWRITEIKFGMTGICDIKSKHLNSGCLNKNREYYMRMLELCDDAPQ